MRQWQRRKTRDQSKEGKKAFQNLQRQLRLIQDENDVDCLYLGIVDAPTLSMIYLVDGAHEDACPPGCFDEYSRTIKQLCDIFYVPIEKMVDDDYDIPEYYEIDRYLPYSQYRLPVEMRDSEHIIIDADLAGGARLHRYTDAGGNECSAIYQFREEVWWHYREHEQRMIRDWNMEHSND